MRCWGVGITAGEKSSSRIDVCGLWMVQCAHVPGELKPCKPLLWLVYTSDFYNVNCSIRPHEMHSIFYGRAEGFHVGNCGLQWEMQVPFVDFFNHDAECQALLSYDEEKACAEVLYLPFLQCNIECLYFCHTMDFQIELHCFVHVDLMWNFYAKQTVYCSVRLLGLMLFVKD